MNHATVIGGAKLIVPNILDLKERCRKLQPVEGAKVSTEVTFRVDALPRLIAKAAHGFCVASFGIDGFKHLLPKYILGEDERIFHVVGGAVTQFTTRQPAGYSIDPTVRCINGKYYATAIVRLFIDLDFPIYEVVAGEASPALVRAALALGMSPQSP
jgi:hypothetical protein